LELAVAYGNKGPLPNDVLARVKDVWASWGE